MSPLGFCPLPPKLVSYLWNLIINKKVHWSYLVNGLKNNAMSFTLSGTRRNVLSYCRTHICWVLLLRGFPGTLRDWRHVRWGVRSITSMSSKDKRHSRLCTQMNLRGNSHWLRAHHSNTYCYLFTLLSNLSQHTSPFPYPLPNSFSRQIWQNLF